MEEPGGRDFRESLKKTHKTSYLVLTFTLVIVGSILLSPVLSASTNVCGSCHGGYYQYLDILEGNGGNALPATITVGQSSTVTVVVENRINAGRYTSLSSVSLTLTSQNGRFTVSTPTYNIGTLSAGTASATWQITGTSAGPDALVITANGRNSHQGLSFSDRYSPSPSISIQAAQPPPPPPPPAPTIYRVTVPFSQNGTTTPPPGVHSYSSGTSVTFTAVSDTGYEFSYWLVNSIINTNNPMTQTITSDTTVAPIFKSVTPPPPPPPTSFTVTILSSPNGTTLPTAGTYNYTAGSSVTFNANPNAGYRFDYWLANGVTNTTNPTSIPIASNIFIEPVFSLLQSSPLPPPLPSTFKVSIQPSNNGTTTPTSGLYNYTAGSSFTFTANPSPGFRFDFWMVNGALNASNPMTLTIESDLVIDPVFALLPSPAPLTVIVQPSQNGSTTPTSDIYNYSIGASVTFTATANTGYEFDRWLVNGEPNLTNPLTMTITTNLEITPVFEQQLPSPAESPPPAENQTSTSPPESLAINLLSPIDGEKWPAGTAQEIRWEATGGKNPLNITIEFSTSEDDGTWIHIAKSLPNNGSVTWVVPRVVTSICIKATAMDNDNSSQSASAVIETKVDATKSEVASFFAAAIVSHCVAFGAFFTGYYSAKGKLFSLPSRTKELAEKKTEVPK